MEYDEEYWERLIQVSWNLGGWWCKAWRDERSNKEYIRRVRNILKSKLNGGNIISAINSRAVSMVRYGAGIRNWTKMETEEVNWKTRKLMTMYGDSTLKQMLIVCTCTEMWGRERSNRTGGLCASRSAKPWEVPKYCLREDIKRTKSLQNHWKQ